MAVSTSLTPETVQAFAPDPASFKAGQKLAVPGKWPTLARDGDVLWGEAQGSGAHPYLVAADLRTPEFASKCSCPSRKFPCKHALGLLLLHAAGAGSWQSAAVPEELNKWLEGRTQRAQAAPKASEAVDPAAQAKRQEKREKKMDAGLGELERWLGDLVREGLLAARTRAYADWDRQAARMVDAQLPGAARRIRELPQHLHEESGEALLRALGELYLLAQGWRQRESLSGAERADLLTALGVGFDRLALAPAEPADWWVAGAVTEDEGRLTLRRTWLLGEGGQSALLLDFAPQGQALPAPLPPLTRLRGAVAYAPSAFPQRAVLGEVAGEAVAAPLPPQGRRLAEVPALFAQALALNPWLERVGVLVGPVYFGRNPAQLCDLAGHALRLDGRVTPDELWRWQAQCATESAYVFGEWNGVAFLPLAVTPQAEAQP